MRVWCAVAVGVTACADLVLRDVYHHLGECVDVVADGAEVGCEGAEWGRGVVGGHRRAHQPSFADELGDVWSLIRSMLSRMELIVVRVVGKSKSSRTGGQGVVC